jgi:hypothetical protein
METKLLANEAAAVPVPAACAPGPIALPAPAAGRALERLSALSGEGLGIANSYEEGA